MATNYTVSQMRLWPRLLTAAKAYPELRKVLIELLEKGAGLTVNDTGGLRLEKGDCVEYQGIRASKLAPQEAPMKEIMRLARGPHPWELPVTQAYEGLRKRCQEIEEVMIAATAVRDDATMTAMAPKIIVMHLHASAMARVLADAGIGRAEDVAHHRKEAAMHSEFLKAAGQPWPDDPGPYPVDTPAGWLWVTDTDANVTPAPVDLGPDRGTKEPGPGEPVVTAYELTMALAPITDQLLREAV